MIRCHTARALMAEALYDELPAGRRRKFEVHLAACAECAREFEGLAATLKVMDTLGPATAPPGYWAGFWNRLLPRLQPAAVGAGVKDWLERFRLPVVPGAPAWALRARRHAQLRRPLTLPMIRIGPPVAVIVVRKAW